MNKKIVYVGLLLPLVCRPQDNDLPVLELSSQADELNMNDKKTPDESQENQSQDEITGPEEPLELEKNLEDGEEGEDGEDLDPDDQEDSLSLDLDLSESPEYARGNWYEKQQTLKQAHDVYQEVRLKEAAVAQFESVFIAKKNELTNKFEEFLQSLPFGLQQLQNLIDKKLEKLESLSKPSAGLTSQERIKLAETLETKNILKQLKNDLQTIEELYKNADQAMAVLMQQITATHNFEQKAFESYEKIAQVLSDQVAKQLFAEIVAARENIAGIGEYIKNDFSRYFDELSENISKFIVLVDQQLASLKEQAIDLADVQEKAGEPEVLESAPKQPESYMTMIISAIYATGSAITTVIWGIFNWVSGFFA